MGAEVELINLAELNRKMSAIADAIRTITLKEDALGLEGMIADLASIMEFSLSDIEEKLPNMTLDEKLTAMADIIRYRTKLTGLFSLDRMAEVINAFPDAVFSNGKDIYANTDLQDAIDECDDGGTVWLLKDVNADSLQEPIDVTKNIMIDGQGHSMERSSEGTNFFEISKWVDFNVCNLNVEFNPMAMQEPQEEYAFIYVRGASAKVTITDCVLESERGVVFFEESSGRLTVTHSKILGRASNIPVVHLHNGVPAVCIEQDSKIYGSQGPAIYLHGGKALVTISDSLIMANDTILGAIDVHNGSPTINLKGKTEILINTSTHASIRMRGSYSCNPIITLYDNVKLTEGVRAHIYYTTYGRRTGFYVKFADGYTGAKCKVMSTTDNTKNCCIWLENGLDDACSHGGTVCTYDAQIVAEAVARRFEVAYDDDLECYVLNGHSGHCVWTNDDITIEPKISITEVSGVITKIQVTSCTITVANSDYIVGNNLTTTYGWFLNGSPIQDGAIFDLQTFTLPTADVLELEVYVSGRLIDKRGCTSEIEKTLRQAVW